MPEREFPLTIVLRTLGDDCLVAEPLLFPEICGGDKNEQRLRITVRDLASQIVESAPNFTLHHRSMPAEPAIDTVRITLPPPKKMPEWEEPVELTFHTVTWRHTTEAYIAFIPELGIEVVAAREPELRRIVPEHILAALRRNKTAESLYQLALTQRAHKVELDSILMSASIKSPRRIEQDAGKEKEPKAAIEDVGVVLNDQSAAPAYAMETVVEQMADALGGGNPRSLLLIGPSGVGKTAAVHELVRRRKELQMVAVPFWATSGSRLIAGMSGFGMWQKRCQRLCIEAKNAGAVIHFGNIIELMEVGRGGAGGQGIAGFLRPWLSRGDVLAIAECTPEQLPLIERENPNLLQVFQQVRIEEPSAEVGREILVARAKAAKRPFSTFADGWLDALDRLHRRYGTYSAYPGRPLRFLDNLAGDRNPRETIGPAEVISAFSRETGLPRFMLDPDVPLDLAEARTWFAQRVIGQAQAVDLVTDLLATVKAALTRPKRPIASLLFIGPTGVGKTELAKALAEYFFGDRNRLTRFDMSEFATPMAVQRLVGGAFGAEGLLTAKVREQPFSVILFDEFEKAADGFFDLLLQVLGEGRLTDAAGRVGDFSNAIVVMTSNLGAQAFGRGSFGLGKSGGRLDAQRHFTDEVREFLRPELFNRIDRVVPFLPLDPATIRLVAERELTLVRNRDGCKLRGLRITLTDGALQYLADKGYDVRYGARPLKRAIERELLAPLAESLNDYPADLKLVASADVVAGKLNISVAAQTDDSGKAASMSAADSPLAGPAKTCAGLRRLVQRMERCAALLDIQNQLFLAERAEQKRVDYERPFDPVAAAEMDTLRAIIDPAAALGAAIRKHEDDVLLALYGDDAKGFLLHGRLAPLNEEFERILLMLLSWQSPKPDDVTIAIFGDRERARDLARAYVGIAGTHQYSTKLSWFSRYGTDHLLRNYAKTDVFLAQPDKSAFGVALAISGQYAGLRFAGEGGIQAFTIESADKNCLVEVSELPLKEYTPPQNAELPQKPTGPPRRRFNMETELAEDATLGTRLSFKGNHFSLAISEAMELQLRRLMRRVLEQ